MAKNLRKKWNRFVKMKLAVDCRMSGKSGIGAYLDNILPTLIEDMCSTANSSAILLGLPQKRYDELKSRKIVGLEKCESVPCEIKDFSIKETIFFPRGILKKINSCDAYFSPYCNIPGNIMGGIKIPIFCTIHDIIFLDIPLAGRLGTFLRKMFYLRAIKKSAEIFTVSNFSKGRIQEKLHCKKNITVVYSGTPILYEATRLEKGEKTNTIIFVGNIKKHKGLGTLVEAFKKFRAGFSSEDFSNSALPPRLLIVGSKENFRTKDTALEKTISGAEENDIVFTGFLPDEKLKTLIEQARLLVQPSLYEGFGVPPLQALYCGTKAVISDIDVFKEIYAELPVTFFKAGDVDDLARKMREVYFDDSPLPDFEHIYSYKNSAKIILNAIQNRLEN